MKKSFQLVYTSDAMPGYRRKRWGRGFTYLNEKHEHIKQKKILHRIKELAIPPAYQSVWISPISNGHLQATGIDDKNRKQYIYHVLWRDLKNHQKFDKLPEFIKALPLIRKQAKKDLTLKKLCKSKVLAALVLLIDETYARVGHTRYTRKNNSYGLTTLQKKHVNFKNDTIILSYRGKNLTDRTLSSKNNELIKVIKSCEDLRGYRLFQYIDEENKPQPVDAHDLNQYLRSCMNGESCTVKDFRTFAACYETFKRIYKIQPPEDQTNKAKIYKKIVDEVARILGHTPSTCKKYYIAPQIFKQWCTGQIKRWQDKYEVTRITEKQFLRWYERRLTNKEQPIKLKQ